MATPIEHIRERDDNLYRLHGMPLENTNTGDFVAINVTGEMIVEHRAGRVLREAVDRFGSGNFALRRIGHRAVVTWLSVRVAPQ